MQERLLQAALAAHPSPFWTSCFAGSVVEQRRHKILAGRTNPTGQVRFVLCTKDGLRQFGQG